MKNKLSIYLVKKEFEEESEYIKDGFISETLSDTMTLYSKKSPSKCPGWVESFFGNEVDKEFFITKTASAVLSVRVDGRVFLVTFGYGRSMIKLECLEEDFGLKLTLGIIQPEALRKLSLRKIGGNQKLSQEQMPVMSSITDFEIDVNRDLVDMVTGVANDSDISDGMITGGTGINLSADVDLNSIEEYLLKVLREYQSESYKQSFGWIDNIKRIKSKQEIDELNQQLLYLIKNNPDSIIVAVPEIIDWSHTKGFSYGSEHNKPVDDISLDGILSLFLDERELSIEQLKNKHIYQISSNEEPSQRHWSAYKCLFTELDYKESHYCINSGVWYKINADFAKMIDEDYKSTTVSNIVFPNHSEETANEEQYNLAFATSVDSYVNMDQKFVYHGGGGSKFEICDTLTDNKTLIHIKKGSASSTLSHLFNQGLVSAELIREDISFLTKANQTIEKNVKDKGLEPQLKKYQLNQNDELTIVYAIIKPGKEIIPKIPLFSKISLYNAKRKLRAINCKVEIAHIQTKVVDKSKKPKGKTVTTK